MVGVFFANGFEEIEALTVVDLLRRAGIDTCMVSVYPEKDVEGSHGIKVSADRTLQNTNFDELEGIVLPGGAPGFSNLEKCEELMLEVDRFASEKKLVAAICGAPSLLGHRGILNGKVATVYPGMEDHLKGAKAVTNSVITDGNIITSRGVGTAIDFALAIVMYFKGQDAASALAEKIVYLREE